MEKVKKIFNIVTMVFLILLLTYLSVGIIPYEFNVYSYETYANILAYMVVPVYTIYIIYKILNREKIKFLEIIIILIGICLYFSYLYAYNKNIALHGAPGRQEGLLQILLYYGIFLLSSTLNKKYQKPLVVTMIVIGLLQIVLGHVQHMHYPTFLGVDMTKHYSYKFLAASGTFGNPNFYSTYMLMCAVYLFVKVFKGEEKNIKIKIFRFILLLIFIYGLIISNTSGGIITFIIIVSVAFIKLMITKKKFKAFFITLGVLAILLSIVMTKHSMFINRIRNHLIENVTEVGELFQGGIRKETFNGRVYVWHEAISDEGYNTLTGIGIDNFGFLNGSEMICTNVCFDKAHNELIQIYVCEGIVTLVLYLIFIIYIIIYSIKLQKINDIHNYAILIMVVAYLIQGLVNIRVIEIAPMLYMYLGFLMNEEKNSIKIIENESSKNEKKSTKKSTKKSPKNKKKK